VLRLGDAAGRHVGVAGGLAAHLGLAFIDIAGEPIDQPRDSSFEVSIAL
jgi:hypothetical protein